MKRNSPSGVANYSDVVIVGAAGVANTGLTREVLARAEASGERTRWIKAHSPRGSVPWVHSPRPYPTPCPIEYVRRVINSVIAQQGQGRR